MRTWRWHRARRNSRASSIAPPDEEGWTIRLHPVILHSEPYASADLGAASDVDRQVNSVRGCVGLFADSDLTPTLPRRHRGYAMVVTFCRWNHVSRIEYYSPGTGKVSRAA